MAANVSRIVGFLAASMLGAAGAQAQECPAPLQVNAFQMIRNVENDTNLVLLDIGGTTQTFLLGTGSYSTMIGQTAADNLQLRTLPSPVKIMSTSGSSQKEAVIAQFTLGAMTSDETTFQIAPDTRAASGAFVADISRRKPAGLNIKSASKGNSNRVITNNSIFENNEADTSATVYQRAAYAPATDGIFGLDYLTLYDADLDFGSDLFQMYAPDHCAGADVFGKDAAVAAVPYILQDYALRIPIELDGRKFQALVDTSSPDSSLLVDTAKRIYGISPGSRETPAMKSRDGNPGAATFVHAFKALKIGNVTITDPRMMIVPYTTGFAVGDRPVVTGTLLQSQRGLASVPDVVIGMDILRGLRIHIAPKEAVVRIAKAGEPSPEQIDRMRRLYKQFTAQRLAALDRFIATHPGDTAFLNEACQGHARINTALEMAQTYCEQMLKVDPGDVVALEGRALALFQQARYPEALRAYDAVLSKRPWQASALLVRGYAKGRMGDQAGRQADIAAAKAANPAVEAQIRPFNISN